MYALSSAVLFVIICHFRREGKNSLSCLKEFLWCRGWDLNPHELPRSILSRMRLPFRHPGCCRLGLCSIEHLPEGEYGYRAVERAWKNPA